MVLWEDCKWKGVDMSQLVSASDVKKAYRKACLAVHPDKVILFPFSIKTSFPHVPNACLCLLQLIILKKIFFFLQQVGTDNENIAKLIFVELNNAWSDFENDSSQQNLFAT